MLPKFADRSTEIEFDVGMSADTMGSMGPNQPPIPHLKFSTNIRSLRASDLLRIESVPPVWGDRQTLVYQVRHRSDDFDGACLEAEKPEGTIATGPLEPPEVDSLIENRKGNAFNIIKNLFFLTTPQWKSP